MTLLPKVVRLTALLGILCLLPLLAGQIISAQTGVVAGSGVASPSALNYTYLPLVLRNSVPETGRLCRFGVGAPSDIARFPVNDLRIGWYVDWGASQYPSRPGGIQYLQMVHLEQTGPDSYTSVPKGSDLLAIIAAHPGSQWVIGNEPDRRLVQDDVVPHVYALAYHELYTQIKTADPTARIVAGSIVQPTSLRLRYLDMILDDYYTRYGQQMPVDAWNIHAFILNEASCTYVPDDCWGADIPPGMDDREGMRIGVEDNDNINIFKQFIVDFRQWMANRGYQDRPLIITEYGVLMPQDFGYDFDRVNRYMTATFDYLSTAVGPTGLAADKGRLVQAWAWYSLTDRTFNGWLYDAQTGARTPYGDNFVAYTSAIAPAVNLTPVKLWAERGAGQTVKLVAQVANNGNIAASSAIHIRFYDGDPANGGSQIGPDQFLTAIDGCANTKQVTLTWSDAPAGMSTVWVVVDPLNMIAESDESDNRLAATISVGP